MKSQSVGTALVRTVGVVSNAVVTKAGSTDMVAPEQINVDVYEGASGSKGNSTGKKTKRRFGIPGTRMAQWKIRHFTAKKQAAQGHG